MIIGVDIESTGLRPESSQILELGLMLFDDHLVEQDCASWLLHPGDAVDKMSPKVVAMHSESGLIEALFTESTFEANEVQAAAVSQIKAWGVLSSYMFGSSVHFDRFFLRHHMPLLEGQWHYRNLDASSIAAWLEVMGAEKPTKPLAPHRVLDDLRNSASMVRDMTAQLGWEI